MKPNTDPEAGKKNCDLDPPISGGFIFFHYLLFASKQYH